MSQPYVIRGIFFENGRAKIVYLDHINIDDIEEFILQIQAQALVNEIDASKEGVLGDGTDCYSALQGLCDTCPENTKIILPSPTVGLGVGNQLELKTFASNSGQFYLSSRTKTTIVGSVDSALVSVNAAGENITRGGRFENLAFNNTSNTPNAVGLQMEQVDDVLLHCCEAYGKFGIKVGKLMPTNTNVVFHKLWLKGNLLQYPDGIGCSVRGQGSFTGFVNIIQYHIGLRIGRQWHIDRIRGEVCDHVLQLGIDPDGSSAPCEFTCNNLSSEANLYTIECMGGRSTFNLIDMVLHDRHVNGVDPDSGTPCILGIDVQKQGVHSFGRTTIGGGITGIRVNPAIGQKAARFTDVFCGGAGQWDIANANNVICDNTDSGLG